MKVSELGPQLQRPTNESQDAFALEKNKLRKASAQFESLFIHQLLKTMRSSAKADDEGFGMSMSYDMFDQQLSEQLGGSIGIAPMLEKQLSASMGLSDPGKPGVDGQEDAELRRWHGAVHSPDTVQSQAPVDKPEVQAADWQRSRQGFVGAPVFDGDNAPAQGVVSSTFGHRVHPITHNRSFHEGLDIAAKQGSEIRSVMAGKVVHAGPMGSYGQMVEVEHDDGTHARYAHASEIFVRRGDRVEAGETVAAVGSTGSSTAPHLHFEVLKGERAIDPAPYLRNLAARRYGDQQRGE